MSESTQQEAGRRVKDHAPGWCCPCQKCRKAYRLTPTPEQEPSDG